MALSKEEAKRLSIISVAEQLGIELKRTGSYSYIWTEHDSFVIDTRKNEFHWNSRTEFGDVIQLVQSIKGVSYKEAMHFLETGEFKQVNSEAQMAPKEPFYYNLERYENQDFSASRSYLNAQRGLSEDTINFFISQGSMAEATRKKGDYFEPVIVFKYKDNTGFLAGASLQGIVENRVHYPERGRLKQIMRNSDGQLGFSIDIGIPKRLVFAEAPIDLMSYYDLHKDALQDVRLVAMDGVKEGVISRRFMELYAEINDKSYQVNQNTGKALEVVARTTNYFKDGQHQDMITLAVDNDAAGHNFITRLQEKGIPVQIAIPPIIRADQEKEDWNDFLKSEKEAPKDLAHVYIADEKSWHYQGFFEKEIALAKAQKLTADDVKAFVSDRQLTREEVRQEYQTIINQERGRKNSMSKLHENSSEHEDDLVNNPQQADRIPVQPETQAIIDSGDVKQWAKHPHIYFVKGLRQVALELTEEGKFEQSSQYFPNTDEEKEVVNKLLSKQKKQNKVVLEDNQSSVLNIDTSNLSPEDVEWLKQNWDNISFSVESKKQMVIDSDKTVTFEKPSDPVGYTFEVQEQIQSTEKAPESSQEQMNDRTSGGTGSLQLEAEGSPTPVLETSTFEQTVTSHPTSSYPYLHFSTNYDNVQRRIGNYHPITPSDLRRLNQYAPSIQSTASWYLSELAGSKISFVYADNGEENVLQVTFLKENFIHLSGIRPFEEGKGAADFLEDFATGQGHYDSMLVSNAIKDKLQVLPMFQDILEPQSFVLDDLSSVEKLHNLNMSEAIKAKDEDFLLLFKDAEGEKIPASLMKLKGELAANVKSLDEKVILGVYRERDNQIEQLSINEEFVTDGGEEMLDNLKNQLSSLNEPSQEQKTTLSPVEKNIDAAIFTQVLDDARNVGNFVELGVTIPEEAKEAWAKYIELSDVSSGDFNTIVLKAEELGLLDKNSSFYQEWRLEDIYNNNYHVRFQWLEEQENNLKLQFEEHSLVSYQDFARELYKANQETKNNTEANISKIKFDIYAPGGEMIKEGVRFNIGDETKPISQMLGLGYRRLKGQPILANIDENVLSQLENLALNQEISHEANNPQNSLATPETDLTASPAEEKEFRSPKQETKGQLEQRVNEIVADNQKAAEEVAPAKESPGEIDYSLVSPHELSEIAFQKIREFTRSPEALAEYMDFMSKFPQLSPRNVALIQDQWQGANAVATYNQWQALGKTLGIKPEDVIETRNTYTNKRTGETKEVVHQGLSVKSGEKAQITLFRPLMAKMIPVLDDQGNQVKNSKGNPKFKKISEATTQEKALLKEGKLKVVQFQERDQETGLPKFTTYKVFELSQTTLKPESYPKAMPNRQYQFDTDQVKTKEVLDGLCDYAGTLGVRLLRDEVHELGNAKGAFYPGEQKILLNPNNLPGEQIATTIHELAHATLHNPKFTAHYKEDVSTPRKELEAEMTSHLVSKHFGLDTSEAAIDYMAGWTKNLTQLDDKQLAESMKRIHQTVSKMVKHIEHHTKPYEPPKNRGQSPNFPKSPTKGLKP